MNEKHKIDVLSSIDYKSKYTRWLIKKIISYTYIEVNLNVLVRLKKNLDILLA